MTLDTVPVYRCASCGYIYMEILTECDCVVGKPFVYDEGLAIFAAAKDLTPIFEEE